jgi:hypothetical protein
MNDSTDHRLGTLAPNQQRRFLLSAVAAGVAAMCWPWGHAQTAAPGSTPKASSEFLRVSQLLTGRNAFKSSMADRLYAALVAADDQFQQQVRDLAAFIERQQLSASNLQAALDEANEPFARLPASIAGAWYLGVAGAGSKARCVVFEDSLMNQLVADRLRPPSYAYGSYGSWNAAPYTL